MGAKGVKRPDLPCERSPPGGSSSLRSTAAEASQQATRAIAALTRRMHRMPISCQRGRVLRRFRQNACHVDTQNAQNADFLSTRPRCYRWDAQKRCRWSNGLLWCGCDGAGLSSNGAGHDSNGAGLGPNGAGVSTYRRSVAAKWLTINQLAQLTGTIFAPVSCTNSLIFSTLSATPSATERHRAPRPESRKAPYPTASQSSTATGHTPRRAPALSGPRRRGRGPRRAYRRGWRARSRCRPAAS